MPTVAIAAVLRIISCLRFAAETWSDPGDLAAARIWPLPPRFQARKIAGESRWRRALMAHSLDRVQS